MLVRLGWQKILWPHHQVGLQWTKSPPIDAQLRQQSPRPIPTYSPMKTAGPTYPHVKPTYGAKMQYSQVEDNSPALDNAGKKFIQEVCGVFLYLARAVDEGLLPALSSLASQQANPTEKTMELFKQILDYMATQEDAILTYHASNMVLAIHSNTSYLSKPISCSCAGGHMFMAGKDNIPFNNGAILKISQIIQAVVSSVVEAELGALFINVKQLSQCTKHL
jgi:hypothetical protein